MIKKIAILGSTGSVGTNALRVIEALDSDYQVVALTAHSNVELLAEQVEKFKPQYAAITDPQKADEFRNQIPDFKGQVLVGSQALVDIAQLDQVDIVLTAIVGAAGLHAVLAAAEKGKILAIANKEPLVIAGKLVTETAKQNHAAIIPVDSEHSAIFQALQAGQRNEVKKIILTASGGPFRGASPEQAADAGLEEALAHPTWNMGPKITVDSATMVNKALEVIEAVWLFDVTVDKIDVLVHPESIVHSLVEFVDGSVIGQLSNPDMCLPIQYALTFPNRVRGISPPLILEQLGTLTFEKPDLNVFRGLKLGFEAAATGGTAPAVFNAANEAAVEHFLSGRMKLGKIVELIEHCLSIHKVREEPDLQQLLQADKWAREQVSRLLGIVKSGVS